MNERFPGQGGQGGHGGTGGTSAEGQPGHPGEPGKPGQPGEENGAVRVLHQILRAQKIMTRATVVLFILLALFGGVAWTIRANDVRYVNRIATQNQTALCAFRADVQARVASSEQFLEDHPNGIPGISPAVIRSNITNQQRTVDALEILRCGGG